MLSKPALGAVMLLAGFCASAWAQAETEWARLVLTAEDARFAAMVRGDTAALAGMLADDLGYVHTSGRAETKAEFLTAVGSQVLRYRSFQPTERRVIPLGPDAAVVMGRADVRVTFRGEDLAVDTRYLAAYTRAGGQWRLRAWQTTRVTPPAGG